MDTLLEDMPPAEAIPATAGGPAPTATGRVIAVVQAAGQRIGIDGAQVVQAVVVPRDLAAVPRRAGAIAGVMRYGDQLVPVVRLEDWLQTLAVACADDAPPAAPGSAASEARVVVLREDGRVVGLLVAAAIGMQ